MFGFSTGKNAYPSVYTVVQVRKSPKKESSSPPSKEQIHSTDSLEPAIDGPPSPERIRAYTEQMKRSSIFGNNSRTNTLSSSTSSFRSRESTATSADNLSLSRHSSGRSRGSSMPSSRDRPESIQIFGKTLFPRRRRRETHGENVLGRSSSSLALGEDIREDDACRGDNPRRGTMTSSPPPQNFQAAQTRHKISNPYNFQHVTHTGQNQVPNLQSTPQTELVSEFSVIRASQSPSNGELKGIRAQDLHFENFSSEALNTTSSSLEEPQMRHQRQRGVLRKSTVPSHQPYRPVKHSQSHDNIRSPPLAPPRPPRSPLSPTCPIALPARTSSRTASILFETFGPLDTTTIERPQTNGGFRKPTPFGVRSPPPPAPIWSEQHEYFSETVQSHALSTPGDEAWPLTTSPSGTFGTELTDVQEEEEEHAAKRRSKMSATSSELRMSQSVPALRLRSKDQENSSTQPENTVQRPPLSPGFKLFQDSWDNAIDYAYEHEAEANCDYQWERRSFEDDNTIIEEAPTTHVEQPALDLHLEDDDRSVYQGRFRPSLLVPSPYDLPELSPLSNASTISDPRTPSNFLRPHHVRSPSHASSFKESHGFTLSPTLLIPADFQLQMEQDALYDEHFNNNATSASIFLPEPFNHSTSPIDESISSTASYRSSNFSRGSARSSSSTRISGTNSRGSQDSVMLLSRSASMSQAHRSIGSASSLPDLIPSMLQMVEQPQETELSASVSILNQEAVRDTEASTPTPDVSDPANGFSPAQHRRNKSVSQEQMVRKGSNHFAPPPKFLNDHDHNNLSPVAESFLDFQKDDKSGNVHNRKVSAPIVSQTVKEYKPRPRANTSAASSGAINRVAGKKSPKRGSYMLFPAV